MCLLKAYLFFFSLVYNNMCKRHSGPRPRIFFLLYPKPLLLFFCEVHLDKSDSPNSCDCTDLLIYPWWMPPVHEEVHVCEISSLALTAIQGCPCCSVYGKVKRRAELQVLFRKISRPNSSVSSGIRGILIEPLPTACHQSSATVTHIKREWFNTSLD